MKKLFLILSTILLVGIYNVQAATQNSLNNFSTSFNIGSYMQTTYYRWKCNSKNQCEKTQTKTNDDFSSELECSHSCGLNPLPSSTPKNFLNNSGTITTPTVSDSFYYSKPSNLNTGGFQTTIEPNPQVNLPKTSATGISGLSFPTVNFPITVPQTNSSSGVKGGILSLPTIKMNDPTSLEPGVLGKNALNGILQGLGIIKPATLPTEEEKILTIPKPGDDDIVPMDFNPVFDYCNVRFLKSGVNKLNEVEIEVVMSDCKETYPIFFSMQYVDKSNANKEIFSEDVSGNGSFKKKFTIPKDIKKNKGEADFVFNLYQCRPPENRYRIEQSNPVCLENIKNRYNNYYKVDSHSLRASIADLDDNIDSHCSFKLVSPLDSSDTRVYTEGVDSNLLVALNIECRGDKGSSGADVIDVDYEITCQNFDGTLVKNTLAGIAFGVVAKDKMEIIYTNSQNYLIKNFNLRETFYSLGNIDQCHLKISINNREQNEKTYVSAAFKVRSCILDLKKINNVNTQNVYRDDPYVPFEIYTRCDNFNNNNFNSMFLICRDRAEDRQNNWESEHIIDLSSEKVNLVSQNRDKNFIVTMANRRDDQKVKYWTETCEVAYIKGNIRYWNSPLAKTVNLNYYSENRPESDPFPEVHNKSIGTLTTTNTTGKNDSVNSKPNIFTRIWNFFKLNLR